MRAWILALLVLFALPVGAQGWNTQPDAAGTSVELMKPGDVAYYRFTDATDSRGVAIYNCGSADVQLNEGTGSQVHLYKCQSSAIADVTATSDCTKVLADKDGDGTLEDETLDGTSGRTGYSGVTGVWLYVNVVVSSGTSVVSATCQH